MFSFNKEKARSALIYLLKEYPGVTKTQIMKFFFLVDFYMYARRARPVFGGVYIHMQRGPVPIDVHKKLLPSMIKNGEIIVEFSKNKGARHYVAEHLFPKIDIFTIEELDAMYKVISVLRNLKTAWNASEFTHRLVLWRYTKNGEPIPYEFVNMSEKEIRDYLEKRRFYAKLANELPAWDEIPDEYWTDYDISIPIELQKEMLKQTFVEDQL